MWFDNNVNMVIYACHSIQWYRFAMRWIAAENGTVFGFFLSNFPGLGFDLKWRFMPPQSNFGIDEGSVSGKLTIDYD